MTKLTAEDVERINIAMKAATEAFAEFGKLFTAQAVMDRAWSDNREALDRMVKGFDDEDLERLKTAAVRVRLAVIRERNRRRAVESDRIQDEAEMGKVLRPEEWRPGDPLHTEASGWLRCTACATEAGPGLSVPLACPECGAPMEERP